MVLDDEYGFCCCKELMVYKLFIKFILIDKKAYTSIPFYTYTLYKEL